MIIPQVGSVSPSISATRGARKPGRNDASALTFATGDFALASFANSAVIFGP